MTLPSLDNGFIDLHDNGADPLPGKTRWGLTIDLNKSEHRWNINFGVISDDKLLSQTESPNLTQAQRARLRSLMEGYVEQEHHANPLVHIAHAKRNLSPGTGSYRLKADFDVLAILDLRKGTDDPRVLLVWGDESYILKDWFSPWTPNDTIVARHNLEAAKLGGGE